MKRFLILFNVLITYNLFCQPYFPNKKSVLADGDIYKIAISNNGIHKITRKNLQDLGININNLNPKHIKIFINYGGTLPEAISESYPDDLIQIPIIVKGEDDLKFDENDLILFYAEGADKWKYEAGIKEWVFDKNIYSDKNYAFIKISNEDGIRLKPYSIKDATSSFTTDINEVSEVVTVDRYNLLGLNLNTHGSGKLWVGDYIQKNTELDLTSKFNTKNYISGPIRFHAQLIGRTDIPSNFDIVVGDKSFKQNINSVSLTGNEVLYARINNIKGTSNWTTGSKISIKHNAVDAWLDHLTIYTNQKINNESGQTFIRNKNFENKPYSTLNLNGAIGDLLDVTNLKELKLYQINNNTANIETGKVGQNLLLYKENSAYDIEIVGKIENQNLHELTEEELIIVYAKPFKNAAEKLAKHRQSHNNYKVKAIDVEHIYNEFSAGKCDPSAIRNFARMLHERNSKYKYLLLIGDGSYDYKGLIKGIPAHNFIPVYETDESLNPIDAYPTDDYYALLSNNEGASLRGALDINVGRLTVTTAGEAMDVVNKIIDYDISPNRFGEWKLNGGFTADDEDGNDHMEDADEIARNSFNSDPIFNQQKIYLDAYKQENTPGGERYNQATLEINQNIDKGQLTWTYLGHGGPKGLAQERVVKLNDIENWNNKDKYTLFITATCSFAGYDDPSITTGGELALQNPNGGAIALLTTTRSVYASENKRLTSNVYKNLYKKENGESLTFGEIIKRAKNASYADTTGNNARKFTLLGDPSQSLSQPKHSIIISKINGKDLATFNDTLGAFDKLEIRGYIADIISNNQLSNFNGLLDIIIFDKKSRITTLANNGGNKFSFDVFKNIIFKGKTNVVNGEFLVQCFIPKDINYEVGKGRISLYATNNETDAAGYYNDLIIGGSSKSGIITNDNPPQMQVFMNDTKFVYGGITDNKPKILLKLSDDFGINTTGNSIGHDITARLIGEDIDEEFILNDFYKADANNFRSGEVIFPLSKLKPGKYTVRAKAWDIGNNSVEGITEFRVIDNNNTKLQNVVNYPNPFFSNTTFSFEHDIAGTDVDIILNIYTITGKLIKSITQSEYSTGYRISNINWDGKDEFGSSLARGVYIYKVILKAPSLKLMRESDFQKLVKL